MVTIPDRINGIDLCSLQDAVPLNAKVIKEAGFAFAYVKASQYSNLPDSRFDSLVDRLSAEGISVGAYHFCAHDTDPRKQAEFFFRASRGLGTKRGQLPPMADWEFCTATRYPNHPTHCVTWIETFLQRCTELWYPDNDHCSVPRLPVIYTYPYYAAGHQPALASSELGKYPLCYASYTTGTTLQPSRIPDHPLPKPWLKWTLCQHKGNDGRVPGIVGACDMQVFNSTSGDWDQFLGLVRPPHLTVKDVKEDEVPQQI